MSGAVNLAEQFQSGAEVRFGGTVLSALLPDLSQRVVQFTSNFRLFLELRINPFFSIPDRVNEFDIGAFAMSWPGVYRVGVGKSGAQEFIDAARLVTLPLSYRGLILRHSLLRAGDSRLPHRQGDPTQQRQHYQRSSRNNHSVPSHEFRATIGKRVAARRHRQPIEMSPDVLGELLDRRISPLRLFA